MRDFPHDCGTVDTYAYLALQLRLVVREQTETTVGVSGAAEVARHEVAGLDEPHGEQALLRTVGERDADGAVALLLMYTPEPPGDIVRGHLLRENK